MCTEGTEGQNLFYFKINTQIKPVETYSCIWFILYAVGCENPKPCQTELTVLEYGAYDGDPVTKVLLQPLTGTVSSTVHKNIDVVKLKKSLKYQKPCRTDAPAPSALQCHWSPHSGRLYLQSTHRQRSVSHDAARLLPPHSSREWTHPCHSPRSLYTQPRPQMGTTKMCEHSGGFTEEYFNRATSWDPRRTRASEQEEQPSGEWGATGTVSAVVMWMERGLRNTRAVLPVTAQATLQAAYRVPSSLKASPPQEQCTGRTEGIKGH